MIAIGATPASGFDAPVGVLSDCHRRIEHFVGVMVKVTGRAAGQRLDDDQREALQTAVQYFRELAPRHKQDEEESLFPRLRACGDRQVQATIKRLADLEADHLMADALHQEVNHGVHIWLDRGSLGLQEFYQLSNALHALQALYREHIHLEEMEVFPAALEALSPPALQDVGREMAVRRQLAFVPGDHVRAPLRKTA